MTLQRRNGIRALTPLPSETVPVAVYLGTTQDGKRALFLVSSEVTAHERHRPAACRLLRTARCSASRASRARTCSTADGKTYRIKVVQNQRVVSSKPPQG